MPSNDQRVCRPSVICDDWVQKGFHIHVGNVELAVRPGHRKGMIVFKRVFRSDAWSDIDAARRRVIQDCLSDRLIREKWIAILGRAMVYLDGYNGELPELANGRKYEFRRLQKALLSYVEE